MLIKNKSRAPIHNYLHKRHVKNAKTAETFRLSMKIIFFNDVNREILIIFFYADKHFLLAEFEKREKFCENLTENFNLIFMHEKNTFSCVRISKRNVAKRQLKIFAIEKEENVSKYRIKRGKKIKKKISMRKKEIDIGYWDLMC